MIMKKTKQTVIVTLIVVAMLNIGSSIVSSQDRVGNGIMELRNEDAGKDLVGVWEAFEVPAENDCATGLPLAGTPSIRVLNTFSQGGTGWLEDNAPFDGPYRTTGATIWKQTSGRNYTYINVHYVFMPDKTFTLTIKQRSNVKLSSDGNSFTEKGTFDVVIPTGAVVHSGCFSATSHRIQL